MATRERPANGGVQWHEQWNAFECYGCGEFEEIRDRHKRTPEKLAEIRQLLVIDHTEAAPTSKGKEETLPKTVRS